MRQESVSSSDTSMEEEETQEAEEVHMRDLLGNEEDDVEEAASQLMPDDVVGQLVGGSNSAEIARREVSKQGSGLAKLWEDRSLFTQELSQEQNNKQESQTSNKSQGGRCESDQQLHQRHQPQGKVSAGALTEQVVTLEEDMDLQEVETQEEEVTVTPAEVATAQKELEASLHLELETSYQSEVGDDDAPSQELQVLFYVPSHRRHQGLSNDIALVLPPICKYSE